MSYTYACLLCTEPVLLNTRQKYPCILQCGHIFHEECVARRTNGDNNAKCPTCRKGDCENILRTVLEDNNNSNADVLFYKKLIKQCRFNKVILKSLLDSSRSLNLRQHANHAKKLLVESDVIIKKLKDTVRILYQHDGFIKRFLNEFQEN